MYDLVQYANGKLYFILASSFVLKRGADLFLQLTSMHSALDCIVGIHTRKQTINTNGIAISHCNKYVHINSV